MEFEDNKGRGLGVKDGRMDDVGRRRTSTKVQELALNHEIPGMGNITRKEDRNCKIKISRRLAEGKSPGRFVVWGWRE